MLLKTAISQRRLRRLVRSAMCLLATSPLLCALALADEFTWNGNGDGSFHDPTRWTPSDGAPPGAGDTAIFDASDTVNFTSSVVNDSLQVIGRGDISFAGIGTNSYTVNDANINATIGGSLTIVALDFHVESELLVDFSLLNVSPLGKVNAASLVVKSSVIDVDGPAELNVTGAVPMVISGNGVLDFRNDSRGDLRNVQVESGRFNVLSNSGVTVEKLAVQTMPNLNANVSIIGNANLFLTDADSLTIGVTDEEGGTMGIFGVSAGSQVEAAGRTNVNQSGDLQIGFGGTFNALDDVSVDGGFLFVHEDGLFNLGDSQSLTAENGADILIDRNYDINNGTEVFIRSGSSLTVADDLNVGFLSDGRLSVVGPQTILTTDSTLTSIWGSRANATIRIGDHAEANIGHVELASGGPTEGDLLIDSGGTLNIKNLRMATDGGDSKTTVIVDGDGSVLNQTGTLTIGHASEGSAEMNVIDGGIVRAGGGFGGSVTLNKTGTINLTAGAALTGGAFESLGELNVSGSIQVLEGVFLAHGNVNLDGGTLQEGGDGRFQFAVPSGGRPPGSLMARNDSQVSVKSLDINHGAAFSIESGSNLFVENMDIGNGNGNGTLIVDGEGSSVHITASEDHTQFWGRNGHTATTTFRNGANGDLGNLSIAVQNSMSGTTGILNVESGASISAGIVDLNVHGGETTTGIITVTGNSTLTAEMLNVGSETEIGDDGIAMIQVSNSGRLSATGPDSSVDVGRIGTIVIDGGRVEAANNLDVDGSVSVTQSSGFLSVGRKLGISSNGIVQVTEGGKGNIGGSGNPDEIPEDTLRVGPSGVLAGSGTVLDVLFNDGGRVAPGFSIGTLIVGEYISSTDSVLELEVAGIKAGQFDVFEVSGDATVAGDVVIQFIDEFAPTAGQEFSGLLNVTGVVDISAANFVIRNLADGFEFDVTPQPAGFVFTALTDGVFQQVIGGDYDNSGQVEQGDLDLVLLHWGESATPIPEGWINDPPIGLIDQAELDAVLLSWGSAASLDATGAVPEPDAALILCLAIIVGIHASRLHHSAKHCRPKPRKGISMSVGIDASR